jgi:hypothetical protein
MTCFVSTCYKWCNPRYKDEYRSISLHDRAPEKGPDVPDASDKKKSLQPADRSSRCWPLECCRRQRGHKARKWISARSLQRPLVDCDIELAAQGQAEDPELNVQP